MSHEINAGGGIVYKRCDNEPLTADDQIITTQTIFTTDTDPRRIMLSVISVEGSPACPNTLDAVPDDDSLPHSNVVLGSDDLQNVTWTRLSHVFSSPSALTHVIAHNLNMPVPDVVVYDTATNQQIIPADVTIVDADNVQIDLVIATAIFGKVH